MKAIIRLVLAIWPVSLLVLSFLIAFCFFWYITKWYPDQKFCERYFKNVPTFECVMSEKYRFDGG